MLFAHDLLSKYRANKCHSKTLNSNSQLVNKKLILRKMTFYSLLFVISVAIFGHETGKKTDFITFYVERENKKLQLSSSENRVFFPLRSNITTTYASIHINCLLELR